jgi:hypothetical protein
MGKWCPGLELDIKLIFLRGIMVEPNTPILELFKWCLNLLKGKNKKNEEKLVFFHHIISSSIVFFRKRERETFLYFSLSLCLIKWYRRGAIVLAETGLGVREKKADYGYIIGNIECVIYIRRAEEGRGIVLHYITNPC